MSFIRTIRGMLLLCALVLLAEGIAVSAAPMGRLSMRVLFAGRNISSESSAFVFSPEYHLIERLKADDAVLTGVLPEGSYLVVVRYDGRDSQVDLAELTVGVVAGTTTNQDVVLARSTPTPEVPRESIPMVPDEHLSELHSSLEGLGAVDFSQIEEALGSLDTVVMPGAHLESLQDMGGFGGMMEMMEQMAGMGLMGDMDLAEVGEMLTEVDAALGGFQGLEAMLDELPDLDTATGLPSFEMDLDMAQREAHMGLEALSGPDRTRAAEEQGALRQEDPLPSYQPFPHGYGGYYPQEVRISLAEDIARSTDHPLLVNLLRSGTVEQARQGAQRLIQIGSPAVPMLTVALSDAKAKVRADAAFILASLTDRQVVPAKEQLLSLLDDPYWRVRTNTLYALAKTGRAHMETIAEVFFHALGDEDGRVRAAAVAALNGGTVYYEMRRFHLMSWSDDSAQEIAGLLADPHPGVRYGALVLLRDARVHIRAVIPALLPCITDPSASIRSEAIELLGRAGVEAGVRPQDIALALEDSQERVVQAATGALARLGEEGAALLTMALGHSRTDVRRAAANSLRSLQEIPVSAILAYVGLLFDPDGGVRREAAMALSRSEGLAQIDAITEELLVALLDPDYLVRARVVQMLGHANPLAYSNLLPSLTQVLIYDQDRTVRTAAAEALGQLGSAETIPDLMAALSDGHNAVIIAAAEALGSLGPQAQAAVNELGTLLTRRSAALARAGIQALVNIGVGSLPVMLNLLEHDDWTTQINAMLALERMGTAAAVALVPLQEMSEHDENETVREAAGNLARKIKLALDH